MPPCPNFSTLAIKLVHSARTKVTFFRISVHLASQYLSLFVYKSRHCMPRMPALCVLIKFKPTVPAGLEWKKKKTEKKWSKNYLAIFRKGASLVAQRVKNFPAMKDTQV